MEKRHTWFYALREMRARPRTFLPLFAIFFGVMLLMGNLLIFAQCQLTSDIAYYKVETQLILPDLTEEEVFLLYFFIRRCSIWQLKYAGWKRKVLRLKKE